MRGVGHLQALFHQELLEVLDDVTRLAVHVQEEVGPVEGGARDHGLDKLQALDDVIPNGGAGSGRQSHNGDLNRTTS